MSLVVCVLYNTETVNTLVSCLVSLLFGVFDVFGRACVAVVRLLLVFLLVVAFADCLVV